MSESAATTLPSPPRVSVKPAAPKPRPAPAWNVVLLDDDDHTYEYVIRMVQAIFGYPLERAFKIAQTVDGQGRAVCFTTHKELAELKREQIIGFGADPLMQRSAGSMSAVIEPALGGGDDDE